MKTAKIIDAVTKATPFRLTARPEEIADPVLFLGSPSANFITGQTLSVSGGLTMVQKNAPLRMENDFNL